MRLWIDLELSNATVACSYGLVDVVLQATYDFPKIIICYIYIALFWVLKALYIGGGESPHPPPMCCIHLDDATAAILRQNANHTPAYWWRGDDEAKQCMGMIRRPWWGQWGNFARKPGLQPYSFFEGHPGIQDLGLTAHLKDGAFDSIYVTILGC